MARVPSGLKCEAPDPVYMSHNRVFGLSCGNIPQDDRAVMTSTSKYAAIPTERNTLDPGGMLCEYCGLSRDGIPQDDRAVMASTGKYASIRAKRNTPSTSGMLRECNYGSSRGGIPRNNRAVGARHWQGYRVS